MEIAAGLWLVLLTIGVAALGLAMAYAARQARNRTAGDKAVTEAATKAEYRREDTEAS